MSNAGILAPFFGVMILTLVVWVYMYIRRTTFLLGNRLDLRKDDTPEKAAKQFLPIGSLSFATLLPTESHIDA